MKQTIQQTAVQKAQRPVARTILIRTRAIRYIRYIRKHTKASCC
jgi:hypothetical protein